MAKRSSGDDVVKSSLTSFTKGGIFTFVVGHEKTRYKVHIEALKAISDPLGYMMTNGQMEESISGDAVLPEVEPEIFEQLIKFAYLGLCGMSDGLVGNATKQTIRIRCHMCSNICDAQFRGTYPYCSTVCQQTCEANTQNCDDWGNAYIVHCIHPDCSGTFQMSTGLAFSLCTSHRNNQIFREEYPDRNANVTPKPDGFNSLQYGTSDLTYDQLSKLLESHRHTQSSSLALVSHAKTYVIAGQYFIEDLQHVCLHKLHRHITNTNFTAGNVDELVDLLTFAYSNTEDGGDILEDKTDALRRLVMKYIVTNSEALLKFSGFREVLCAGGSHTADFVALKFT